MAATRVVKVGGSLFTFDGLIPTLNEWLDSQPKGPIVLLSGGGPLADAIRELDDRFGLGEAFAHEICIDTMRLMSRVLSQALPNTATATDLEELRPLIAKNKGHAKRIVFDCTRFLIADEPTFPGNALPHTWEATSDSIAARLAAAIGADELVLLKSADIPSGTTRAELSAAGYVDEFFPLAAASLPRVRCVNLRSASLPEWLID